MTKMSISEYNSWLNNPVSREASLPQFFGQGVQRTRRVLKRTATDAEIKKWESFQARHVKAYRMNPTARRRIAIKNWGIRLKKRSDEKVNLPVSVKGYYR